MDIDPAFRKLEIKIRNAENLTWSLMNQLHVFLCDQRDSYHALEKTRLLSHGQRARLAWLNRQIDELEEAMRAVSAMPS